MERHRVGTFSIVVRIAVVRVLGLGLRQSDAHDPAADRAQQHRLDGRPQRLSQFFPLNLQFHFLILSWFR